VIETNQRDLSYNIKSYYQISPTAPEKLKTSIVDKKYWDSPRQSLWRGEGRVRVERGFQGKNSHEVCSSIEKGVKGVCTL